MNKNILNYLCCPICHGDLDLTKEHYNCAKCKKKYYVKDGIPDFAVEINESNADNVTNTNTAFFDLTASHYEDNYSLPPKILRFFLKSLVEKESIGNPYCRKRVAEVLSKYYNGEGLFLDVGCGNGNLLELLGPKNSKTIGIDISHQMLVAASKKRLNCARANNYKTPFKDNTFDMISVFSVVHHMVNLELFFKELYRILKKGGTLYTDCDPNPINLFIKENHKLYKITANLIKRILRRDYYGLYKSTGIRMEDVEYHLLQSANSEYNISNMESIWSRTGFEKIGLYYHSNTSSIFHTRLFNEHVINVLRKYILHILAIRTDVHKCSEYILTLLNK